MGTEIAESQIRDDDLLARLAADETITGLWTTSGIRRVGIPPGASGTRILQNVAALDDDNGATTGTIKILIPFAISGALFDNVHLRLSGCNRPGDSAGGFELLLHGFFDATIDSWSFTSAVAIGVIPFSSVRFGHDGTNFCILVGTTSTAWTNPLFFLTELCSEHSTANVAGYTISRITSEAGYTITDTPTLQHVYSPRLPPPGTIYDYNQVDTTETTSSATPVALATADALAWTSYEDEYVLFEFSCMTFNSSVANNSARLLVDGANTYTRSVGLPNINVALPTILSVRVFSSAGAHTAAMNYFCDAGTGSWLGRCFKVSKVTNP